MKPSVPLVALLCVLCDQSPAAVSPDILDLALEPPFINTNPGPEYSDEQRDFAMVIGMDRTPKGRIWAAWVAGGDSDKGYFVAASSDDDGATWSKPRLVIDPPDAPNGLRRRTLVGNFWTDPTGRLWLFFDQSMGYFDGRAGSWAITCDDPDADKPVWSAPRRIWHGATLNKPVVLKNGEWLMPISLWTRDRINPVELRDGFAELDDQRMAHLFVSTDQGATWSRRGGVVIPQSNFDEHMFVELRDGRLWMLARTKYGITETFSSDGGRTWSEPTPSTIQNPSARFFLRRLASGNLLLVKNGPLEQRVGRSQMAAFLSDDEGKSWKGGFVFEERNGVSYPDGFQSPDGVIHILYDRERAKEREILMARFTEADVLAGKLVSPGSQTTMLVSKARGPLSKAEAPYPPSPVIAAMEWAPANEIIRAARDGDNWPVTWADDDAIYTTWGDGTGFVPKVEQKLSMGFARVTGEPEQFTGVNVRSDAEQLGEGRAGRKGWGIICVDSVLYLWLGHADKSGATAQLAWSRDHAKSWTFADWTFAEFGMMGFVNFGRNYSGARDEFVYSYSHDDPRADTPADRFVLMRAPKNKVTSRDGWEFFARLDATGQPVWTKDITERGAVFQNPGACLRSAMTYFAPLKRYLWWQHIPQPPGVTKDRGDTRFTGGFAVYDAPEPWGPWTTAYFTAKWDVGPGEHGDFPTRWMNADGRTLHLVFSGDDSFSVRAAQVKLRAPTPALPEEPLRSSTPPSDLHRLDPRTPQGLQELLRHTGEPLPIVSGHRGGAQKGFPENCVPTFAHTLQSTFAMLEVDPRYAKDGAIVLHHDATLERTTTGKGRVVDFTLSELKQLRLKDTEGRVTEFQIPTLDEVLEWARGKTILVLDQKDVPVAARVGKVVEHKAEAYAMLIVSSFKDVQACYALNANIMMEVMIPNREKVEEFDALGVPWSNVVTFVGHTPPEDPSLYEMIHRRGASCMVGSSRNLDRRFSSREITDLKLLEPDYRAFLRRGADLIETDIPSHLGPMLYGTTPPPSSKKEYFHAR